MPRIDQDDVLGRRLIVDVDAEYQPALLPQQPDAGEPVLDVRRLRDALLGQQSPGGVLDAPLWRRWPLREDFVSEAATG
jgi:hypothetical protein